MKMGFEVVGGAIAEYGMVAFGVVVGNVVADCKPSFCQIRELAPVEQFGFEPAPKRFSVGVVAAVAAPAPSLLGPVPGG